ncbi:MAG: NCS2 family permease [Prevotella sp.]|nr:NCS2 family permease [Prevotella sp.]
MKDKLLHLVGFSRQRHRMRDELIAGLTTFVAMAYILALMPELYAPLAEMGMPVGSIFTSTVLAAVVGTMLMALYAKMPFGSAPGLTLNFFFVNTMCLTLGYPWQFALTAVLIEGLLFTVLCLSGMRYVIFDILPRSLRFSISVGIGIYISKMGLLRAGMPISDDNVFAHMRMLLEPAMQLFIFGLILTSALAILRVRGSLLIGIVCTTLAGVPLGVTRLPEASEMLTLPPSPLPLLCQFDWTDVLTPDMFVCVLIMLFFDVFDTLGTTIGVLANSGMVRRDGRIPHQTQIMLGDAVATSVGACFGTSSVTAYVESVAGVAQGGRTGMTALVVALCFAASLFLAPLFLCIPNAATAPVLIISGFYLFSSVRFIDMTKMTEAVPSFITIVVMPATDSIADGILIGVGSYAMLSAIDRLLHPRRYDDNDEIAEHEQKRQQTVG